VVSIQDGTGNDTRLVSGNVLSLPSGMGSASSHAALPPSTATDATPTTMRASLLCTEAAPFSTVFLDVSRWCFSMVGTLCDRADAIRCHQHA